MSVVIGPRRIAKNSAVLFLAQAYSTLTLFVYIPLLTRYLGQDGYGRYSYAYAFVGLFQVIATLGLHEIFIRETARNKDKAGLYFGNLLILKVILTVVAMALIFAAAILRGMTPEDLLIIGICATEMMIRIYVNLNVSIFRAFEKMEYELLLMFLDRTVGLVGILLVIHLRLGLIAVFVAFLASAVVRGLVAFALTLARFVRPRLGLDMSLWKHFTVASIPIGISLGIQRVYERQGTVILEGTRGVGEVGLYAGALRIYGLSSLAASSLIGALFPVFSQLAISSQERLAKMYQTGLKFLLLLSLPASGAIVIWADDIALLILGPEFVMTSTALRVLAPAIPISFLGYLSSSTLRSADRQATDTMIWASSLVINLFLTLVLAPRYGFAGAALALLVSEAVFASLGLLVVTRRVCPVPVREVLLRPLACGLMAVAAMLALGRLPFPVRLAVGGLVYLTSIYLLGILNAREMALLRQLAISVVPRRNRS